MMEVVVEWRKIRGMEENKDRKCQREKIRFPGRYGEEPEKNKSWLR
jgi:hypothetical protein